MKLGIVYHMPFWRAADGTLREVEGSFARYVDSLAPYFDEISLCVPVLSEARGEGTPIRASNVTLAALPPFDGPVQFYPRLASVLPRLARWVREIDLLHCRVPSPAAVFAFAIARLYRRPGFLLVVGDLRALLPSMPYRGVKRGLVAGVHGVRRAEHSVDGRSRAHVCQRCGARHKAHTARAAGRSKRRRRRSASATSPAARTRAPVGRCGR